MANRYLLCSIYGLVFVILTYLQMFSIKQKQRLMGMYLDRSIGLVKSSSSPGFSRILLCPSCLVAETQGCLSNGLSRAITVLRDNRPSSQSNHPSRRIPVGGPALFLLGSVTKWGGERGHFSLIIIIISYPRTKPPEDRRRLLKLVVGFLIPFLVIELKLL